MIASLLPGLRDLRTSLATGYLWIVGLWLLIHQDVPKTVKTATGPIRSLYELGVIVGSVASLAALTFVAYIIGSILSFKFGTNTNYVLKQRFRFGDSGHPFITVITAMMGYLNASRLIYQLETFLTSIILEARTHLDFSELYDILPPFDRESYDLSSVDQPEHTVNMYVTAIIDDLPAVGIQLQAKDRDFWDTYDRQQAEAHFRMAVSLPMLFIFCTTAAESGQFLWLLLLIVPIILIFSGLRTSVAASSVLIQAVVLKIVEPPVLERLATVVANLALSPDRAQYLIV